MSAKMYFIEFFKVAFFFVVCWMAFVACNPAEGAEIVSAYKQKISAALKAGDVNKAKALSEGLAAYQLSRNQGEQAEMFRHNNDVFVSLNNLLKSLPKGVEVFSAYRKAAGDKETSESTGLILISKALCEAIKKGDFNPAPLKAYFTKVGQKEKSYKDSWKNGK